MGTPIGYFSEQQPNDYPELNKCPDCETFFQTITCPLCGKECPEECRAGNRKPIKQKKTTYTPNNGRVRFVPWYHNGWFILAMLIIFPIVGLILLWQSDNRRSLKIAGTLLPVAIQVVPMAVTLLLPGWYTGYMPDYPEDREAYMSQCEAVDVEAFYRTPANYAGRDLCMELTVQRRVTSVSEYGTESYYLCEAEVGDRIVEILICDYQFDDSKINLMEGDRVKVYGRGVGDLLVYTDANEALSHPGLEMFFAVLTS